MSQSDYIKYKRVSTELSIDNRITNNKLSPVLSSQKYITYSQYDILNSIPNDIPTFNTVNILGTQEIFGMHKLVKDCPSFITCEKTNTRPNRMLLSTIYSNSKPSPLDIKHRNNKLVPLDVESHLITPCSCVIHSKHMDKNICRCKKGAWGIVR